MDALGTPNAALSGRYEIQREIGAGGMATVYFARDIRHDRRVAVKVLKPELGAVLEVERFLTEIRVTANLQHPNLLPLFDSGEADGLLFYVMPFVDGETLRKRLEREKQLPIEEASHIAVAVALDYAHRHDVIHRDLKADNILMHAGQPVIADFGVALAVTNAAGARMTQSGLSITVELQDMSADGRYLVFSVTTIGNRATLRVVPLGGDRTPFLFVKGDFDNSQAVGSPDGHWLAHTSNETGRNKVHVQSFPQPGHKRAISVNGGVQPRWQGEGKELYYLGSNQKIMAVPVRSGTNIEVGSATALFRADLPNWGAGNSGWRTSYDVALMNAGSF